MVNRYLTNREFADWCPGRNGHLSLVADEAWSELLRRTTYREAGRGAGVHARALGNILDAHQVPKENGAGLLLREVVRNAGEDYARVRAQGGTRNAATSMIVDLLGRFLPGGAPLELLADQLADRIDSTARRHQTSSRWMVFGLHATVEPVTSDPNLVAILNRCRVPRSGPYLVLSGEVPAVCHYLDNVPFEWRISAHHLDQKPSAELVETAVGIWDPLSGGNLAHLFLAFPAAEQILRSGRQPS